MLHDVKGQMICNDSLSKHECTISSLTNLFLRKSSHNCKMFSCCRHLFSYLHQSPKLLVDREVFSLITLYIILWYVTNAGDGSCVSVREIPPHPFTYKVFRKSNGVYCTDIRTRIRRIKYLYPVSHFYVYELFMDMEYPDFRFWISGEIR